MKEVNEERERMGWWGSLARARLGHHNRADVGGALLFCCSSSCYTSPQSLPI
ncbi:unnamed protein product [Meloidogyne enterolobii]|uniref:Uncharacterized protein n=1 Tax=Meloidogyne enterolobii TaxID=390850 RepID=A0ACB0XU68_MELEN